jgi:hypothetical protein
MEKVFELLGKIMPLMRYYPRWAQILFGSTMAFMLVSVFIALVKYSSAEERRSSCDPPPEVKTAIETQLSQSMGLYKELGLSLSNWYTSVISLRIHLRQYMESNPNVQRYLKRPLPANLQMDAELTRLNFEKLRSALSAIHQNDFANRCWTAGSANAKKLQEIKQGLMARGFSEAEASIPISDIPYVMQFLALASQKLQDRTFEPLLQAVLTTNSADNPSVGRNIKNENLRMLLVGGNLLFGLVKKGDKGELLIVSWGTAMISDIYRALPNASVCQMQLELAYPRYECYVKNLSPSYPKPESFVDQDFNSAIEDLEKRHDLLIFEVPAPAPQI